ncbi:hypothetical protein L596_014177 [Steinernema carpocapsae]|uniref:RanBD1 domain-containing protein n=1 Tax=Steinernema carpocapsae TaxID=34508 RepID=A0A4U5NBZ4_STECR|nr:hypothetical protein L596_014177 [Steinernema carpocapsae]
MGSSATTPATTAEPAKTWQFSFNPSASPAAATTVAPVATPVAKPLFSFSTSTTSAAPAGGTENKIFGAQSSKTSFDSVSGADIFAGKTSSASSFGDPKDFKFGQAKTVSPQKPAGDHENEDAEDEYEPDAHFEPVVPLPSLVEVKTGEEEEEVLFSERARLYRFVPETKEYKERGTGDIKVLHNPKSNSYRVVMRREQVLKLCANFRLVAGMKAQTRNDGKPTCMFSATDFAEVPEGEQLTLTVRFRTEENRNGFVKFFEQGVEAAASRQGQLVNSPSETPEAQKEEEKPNKEDEEEIPVFEIEVTASLNPAYKSPLKPAKSVKDARIRLVCMYEELAGVGTSTGSTSTTRRPKRSSSATTFGTTSTSRRRSRWSDTPPPTPTASPTTSRSNSTPPRTKTSLTIISTRE